MHSAFIPLGEQETGRNTENRRSALHPDRMPAAHADKVLLSCILQFRLKEIGPKPGPYLSCKNTKTSSSVGEPLFVRSYVSGYRSPLPYLAFGTAFCRSLPNTGSEPAHPRPQPQTAGEQLSERKNVAGNPGPFYGSLLLSLHPDRTATVRPISTIRRNDGCNKNGPSAPEYPCRRFWGKNSLWETDGAGRRRSDTYCPARCPSD